MTSAWAYDDLWFNAEETELPAKVIAEFRRVDDATVDVQQNMLDGYGMYGGGAGWATQFAASMTQGIRGRRPSHNVIAVAADALVSEVTQTQPRPVAMTIGGDWFVQERAREMTQWWDTCWNKHRVRGLMPQVVKDTVVAGTGLLRAYVDWEYETTRVERIFPLRLKMDDRSCGDSPPRDTFLQSQVDKWQLCEQYPELRDAIEQASAPDPRYLPYDICRSNAVEVIEAWHLPSTPTSGDGRRVVVCSTCVLEDDEYKRDRIPIVSMRAIPPAIGWWGESVVNRAVPGQLELNKLVRRIAEAMHVMAVPRVFLPDGSMNEAKITTDVGVVVRYDGKQPPVFLTPPSMAADVYTWAQTLAGWIFEEMGVSQLSATSRKPSGLDSAPAQREYHDAQSRRWVGFERSYTQAHGDLAEELVHAERELAEGVKGHRVEVRSRYGSNSNLRPWTEVDMDDKDFRVIVQVASSLPTDPAGKLEALQELVGAGLIDQQDFYALYDDPDFESIRQRVTAPREALEFVFYTMLKTGEYITPEPFFDLHRGIATAQLIYLQELTKGADDDRLELLREWIDDASALLLRATVAAAPPPANDVMGDPMAMGDPMGGGMPPAGPMPPMPPMPPPGPGAMPAAPPMM